MRVAEIENELAELRRAFPDAWQNFEAFLPGARRRRPMSQDHRRKVSSHMKRYWERWRAARGQGAEADRPMPASQHGQLSQADPSGVPK